MNESISYFLNTTRAVIANLRVVAGEHSLSVDSGLEQIRNITSVVIHPEWDDFTYENDISLHFVS